MQIIKYCISSARAGQLAISTIFACAGVLTVASPFLCGPFSLWLVIGSLVAGACFEAVALIFALPKHRTWQAKCLISVEAIALLVIIIFLVGSPL